MNESPGEPKRVVEPFLGMDRKLMTLPPAYGIRVGLHPAQGGRRGRICCLSGQNHTLPGARGLKPTRKNEIDNDGIRGKGGIALSYNRIGGDIVQRWDLAANGARIHCGRIRQGVDSGHYH